jgi:hypothetical protein
MKEWLDMGSMEVAGKQLYFFQPEIYAQANQSE